MARKTLNRTVLAALTLGLAAAFAGGASAAPSPDAGTALATDRPVLKVPFPCGETWRGNVYEGHRPANAMDMNQGSGDFDKGRIVKASGAGTITTINRWETSYGNHVIVSHGNGWSTLYAHLEDGSIGHLWVGQSVTASTTIGKVGRSGLSSTQSAHLHYEQRLSGNDVQIRFGTSTWALPGDRLYTRAC